MFDNVAKMNVDDASRSEWSSPYLNGGETILVVAPAGQLNDKYFAELLKKTRTGRTNLQKLMFTPAFIEKNRNNDRELYPKYVVHGWKGCVDDDGNPVEFSTEAAKELIRLLPKWIFDDLRDHCTKPENFIEDPVDAEETAGN